MSLYSFAKSVLLPTTRAAFDVRVTGAQNVPRDGGLVVAANHRSYLDPPLLGAWFPRTIHFMAKQELFKLFILGPLIRAVHAFPVDRDRADLGSIRQALRILKGGDVVGIFPEGTRNISGEAQARGGAVLLAATAHCPIVPVALVNTQYAVRRLRASKVEVRIGEPIVLQGTQRKATKAEIEQWTADLSQNIDRLAAN
ncbi:MAG TPA: lysophospholipid acyltransferase family protein [Candidatus Eremiobacteraceae bacterium]|nr:lysophospholipid acyltransferase family protein [Candidatus Eremiobacteraceae bacterium]